ncbi:MAG: IS66 family transposase [Deltaproteobacteria bacterium]|nr:IS66 family transposase [Deltaproteobacteria bacterium]MBK8015043.1 IS66 family transposase [Deltaproteobacteria bacterium]
MSGVLCVRCVRADEERQRLHTTILQLRAETASLTAQLKEMAKVNELQAADLARLKKVIDGQRQPNQPERINEDSLQLAFESVVKGLESRPLAEAAELAKAAADAQPAATPPPKGPRKGNRRELWKAGLPVIEERIVPDEVQACGGAGWRELEPEVTERVAFRRSRFEVIRTTRTRWVRVSEDEGATKGQIVAAPVPDWALPSMMADASLIAEVVMNKYGFALPLHRQERMSGLRGFSLARSTQYDWCEYGALKLAPIVSAMHAESISDSFMIATDATSAPVRVSGGTINWHVFVFISDVGHIFFRAVRRHDGASIGALLQGFRGHLLSDASSIYNGLHLVGILELACWAHVRRYFWKATLTESTLAYEALSIISTLFKVVAESNRISKLSERDAFRVKHATPIVDTFDAWMKQARTRAEPRGRIETALNYATNLHDARRAFLADPRLKLHNNDSERELRSLKKGLDNWMHFETKAGLEVYTVYRSLIASCALHRLNPYDYLEEVLRLVRHWPADRFVELAPKHWLTTRAGLDERLRRVIHPPWRRPDPGPIINAA